MQLTSRKKIVGSQLLPYLFILSAFPFTLQALSEFTTQLTLKENFLSNSTSTLDENGQITTITPGFSYKNNQRRSQLVFDYTFNVERYSGLSNEDTEHQNLSLLYALTHIPDHWVTQLTGNVKQSTVSSDGIQSFNTALNTANTQELRTYAVSTNFNTDFKRSLSLKTQLLADYAGFEGSDNTDSVGFNISLDDQLSQRKLFWNAAVSSRQSSLGDESEELNTFQLGLNYRFNSRYSGYINTQADDTGNADLDETVVMTGLNWQPNRNSSINIGAGVRGSDPSYSLKTKFNKRRLTLSINYNEEITSSRNEVIRQTIDETGIVNTFQSLSITPILQKKADINLTFTGRRSNASISFSTQKRTVNDVAGNDEQTDAISLSMTRTLSAKSSAVFKYQSQSSKTSEQNDLTDIQLAYKRKLSKKINVTAELINTRQLSDVAENEYNQKMFIVTATVAF